MHWLLILASFLIGSLPFGFWIGLLYGKDVRKIGSGNTGATNVIRALGWGPGLFVFFLDVAKGAVASAGALWWQNQPGQAPFLGMQPSDFALLCGVVAVVGHMLSPFLGFKGGKGVATGLGAMLGVAPVVGGIGFGGFLVVLALTRYVSLGSVIGAWAAFATAIATGQSPLLLGVFGLLCAYIIYRHVPNMKRLREGTEPKLGQKTQPSTPDEPEEEVAKT
ncbi:MAG: glycerol-3-phosphate 1-O-acyltransferase PlsY [Fimbriimonadaceae bacterium]|nr:glycerol-3-phosphate 1-O-acyltransferase PlsY [Fimbriimonadaceae bacterium]